MKNFNDLYFRVADCNFRLHFHDIEDARPFLPSYAPFFLMEKPNDVIFTMDIKDGLVNKEILGEKLYEIKQEGNYQQVYGLPNGGYKVFNYGLNNELACIYETNKHFTQCNASLFGSKENQFYCLKNAIMITFAFSGAYHHIALIHSSVTMNDGKGYMFLGVSGTGKSTHSDLWCKHIPGSTILNDDNPAIRIVDDEVRVYGTPWSGKRDFYRQMYVPIGAVVQLKQAPENKMRLVNKLKGFSYLFVSASSMIWDKESYSLLCETISKVAEKVPIYFLENKPEKETAILSYKTCTQSL